MFGNLSLPLGSCSQKSYQLASELQANRILLIHSDNNKVYEIFVQYLFQNYLDYQVNLL